MTVIKSDNLLKTIPFVGVCHYGAPDMPLIMQQPALQFRHILLKMFLVDGLAFHG